MKIQFEKLIVHAKKADFEIPFSESISYFYGKMGAGKSTIPRLIKYCFGGSLKETPALQSQFIGVGLELIIGKNQVKLEREKESRTIIASWKDILNEESNVLQVPVQDKGEILIPNTNVKNISDLIFYLAGLEPPYVLKSKYHTETESIRLGIKDILWYCYLDQDNLDSSFFYLGRGEDFSRRNKSQDALRFILGFKYEEIVKLQNELNKNKEDKSAQLSSIDQLNSFLEENGIKDSKDVQHRITLLKKESEEVESKINTIRKNIYVKSNPVDELNNQRKKLDIFINNTQEKLEDLEFQISNQNKLRSEFITANLKIDRTSIAREVFKNVNFVTCPECGQGLEKSISDACMLCKKPPMEDENEGIVQANPALIERIKEIEYSINELYLEQKRLSFLIESKLKERNEIDDQIVELQKNKDSKYVAVVSTLLERKGILEGKLQYFNDMLIIPRKIEMLEKKVVEISININKIKKQLDEEKGIVEKKQSLLKELEEIFADTLKQVSFPGFNEKDNLKIPIETYLPEISSKEKTDQTVTGFYNLGSGGKKTIFKSCFALALHRLASKEKLSLPSFLIIDTPMKNISERENEDVFNGFYQFLYKLSSTELKDRQIIMIDKEYYKDESDEVDILVRHMTPDDPENPPLIEYYRGH